MSDRRVWFFVIAGLVSAALYLPSPPEFRWVTVVLAGVYFVLAALTALDNWSRNRQP